MSIADFWDAAAESFDEEADHGLRDPRVRNAWAARLRSWLPDPPGDVLDLGCGTGSLSLLLARGGYRVVGVDLSSKMAGIARRKIAGLDAHVLVGDAADPPVRGRRFAAVLGRHLLWTLPDPAAVLRRWVGLAPVIVLIEGVWNTPASPYASDALPWMGGVSADTLADTLRPLVHDLRVEPLTDPDLWDRAIDDERYAIIARTLTP